MQEQIEFDTDALLSVHEFCVQLETTLIGNAKRIATEDGRNMITLDDMRTSIMTTHIDQDWTYRHAVI